MQLLHSQHVKTEFPGLARWTRAIHEEGRSAVIGNSGRFGAIALGAALLVTACGGGSAPASSVPPTTGTPAAGASGTPGASAPASGGALSGTITISGSSTVQPISQAVQELFNTTNPGVAIVVDGPGTGAGFSLFCKGETDIQDASRAIKATGEADVCAKNGIEYMELKVALDGLSIITAAANDTVSCLSFNDLYALLGPEAGPVNPIHGASPMTVTNWKDAQLLASALGSKTVFPDAPLTITGPGEESGTYDFLVATVIVPIATARKVPTDKQVARPDYQASADDNAIITGVAGTPDNKSTLGWVGFAFVEENLDKVKPLDVDGGKGCVAPSHDTIANASYPISRDLYLYVNKARAASNPALAAYVGLYLADGTVDNVLKTVPYVALAKDEFKKTQDAWAAR
jgi:phosphate transport system substrate-binding protein